jgi:hypothetical protein
MPSPRTDNLQRPGWHSSVKAEIELGLTRCDPLRGDPPQRRQFALVVRRAEVLDLPRTPP